MKKTKIIFIGTGNIGTQLLQSLSQDNRFKLALVVTGQDKPVGRKLELTPNAIKQLALTLNIEVFQPDNIKSPEAIEKLRSYAADLFVVIAYGQILSQEVLDLPKIECLNVHASLLPKYRGASPIQSAILNGEKETGITLMKMVKQMDAGAMYQHFKIPITSDTSASLEEKLSHLASQKIPDALIEVAEGKLKPLEQNEADATYVTKISKADGQIDWQEPAELIERKIRAFHPWPSTYTFYQGKRLKILGAMAEDFQTSETPGTVIEKEGQACIVTGKGLLILHEVQMEGKKPQTIKEFLNGNPDFLEATLPT